MQVRQEANKYLTKREGEERQVDRQTDRPMRRKSEREGERRESVLYAHRCMCAHTSIGLCGVKWKIFRLGIKPRACLLYTSRCV